jgi:hypothetical protein
MPLKQIPTESPTLRCEAIQWKGRDAVRLTNGIVELISLAGGGHLASFRFLAQTGLSSENIFWEAPWETIDPVRNWTEDLSQIYGPAEIGKFLASYTGHALCLDYFGEPSRESIAAGLSLHGEAAITQWSAEWPSGSEIAHCHWTAKLPVKQLTFKREIRLGDKQSVTYIEETVSNHSASDHRCDWVQHVTFGPPFLRSGESTLLASATHGITSAYEGGCLLESDRQFTWPFATRASAGGPADLRQPFSVKGQGFLAGVQFDAAREEEFLLAVNWRSRLGVGYCFRRCDFPWMTLWEENCTRQNSPWNGITVARGMEFGTTPLPFGESATPRGDLISDSPTGCVIPAHDKKTVRYLIFLFSLPAQLSFIQDAATSGDAILLRDGHGELALALPAYGAEAFLAQNAGQTTKSKLT